ncbi:hypothetical protein ROBYS_06580 [Roseobacter sp. OBYS 0001]|nr:hypothetical protein ROBYS_06580 [Roseobacter sp. OBYS 0001]
MRNRDGEEAPDPAKKVVKNTCRKPSLLSDNCSGDISGDLVKWFQFHVFYINEGKFSGFWCRCTARRSGKACTQ